VTAQATPPPGYGPRPAAWSPPPTAPPPAAALARELHDLVQGRPGWRPVALFSACAVLAEYRPALGGAGGVVVGCADRWWWAADDGTGVPLDPHQLVNGPLYTPSATRDALEGAVRAHLRVP
jgi:hypothetical protein